jgi:lysophospholipase L1-like esterase
MSRISTLLTAAALVCGGLLQAAPQPLIHSGESIVFMGDSITMYSGKEKSGFVQLVASGLKTNGVEIKAVPRGRWHENAGHMLARLEKDVLSKKPTWLALNCGTVDACGWNSRGLPIDKYKANIRQIVEQTQQAGIKVMILTATMVELDPAYRYNQKIDTYNAFLHQIAAEKGCLVADLNQAMKTAIAQAGASVKLPLLLSQSHLDTEGDLLVAKSVLRSFGLSQEMIDKSEAKWLVMPQACSMTIHSRFQPKITIQERRTLDKIVAEKGGSLQSLLWHAMDEIIKNELKK